jgi:hypothetical protein
MTPVQPSRFGHAHRLLGRLFGGLKSENVGGLVSMAGSSLFLLGGDASGVVVAVSFLAAELVLARFGHRRAGYSAGCFLFAFGDTVAVSSELARGNATFQVTLLVMAAAWLVGAARAPLALLGERTGSVRLVRIADALQPIAGIATLTLRLPGIAIALGGGNLVAAVAIGCWAASDILVGRLQDFVRGRGDPPASRSSADRRSQ